MRRASPTRTGLRDVRCDWCVCCAILYVLMLGGLCCRILYHMPHVVCPHCRACTAVSVYSRPSLLLVHLACFSRLVCSLCDTSAICKAGERECMKCRRRGTRCVPSDMVSLAWYYVRSWIRSALIALVERQGME